MTDRITSDNPSITTVRAKLGRHGGTNRLCIEIAPDDRSYFPVENVVRIVLDGRTYHARIDQPLAGTGRLITGAYDSPRIARSPEETLNRLPDWIDAVEIEGDGSVLVDVIEPGFAYGLRRPGTTTIYAAVEPPNQRLADIARSIESAGTDNEDSPFHEQQ